MGAYWENKEFSYFSHRNCELFSLSQGRGCGKLQLSVLLLPFVCAGKRLRGEFPHDRERAEGLQQLFDSS